MAENKNSNADLNFEDLLSLGDDEEAATAPEAEAEEVIELPKESAAEVETVPEKEIVQEKASEPKDAAKDAQIAALEAALAASRAAAPVEDPKDKIIRELQEQLAVQNAKNLDEAPTTFEEKKGNEKTILIHFIINGFTAQGVGWQRGQEIEFVVGGQAYEQTKDRKGNTWLDLRNDPAAQIRRYGAEYFREGPFRGLQIGDTTGLTDPDDIAAVQEAAKLEAKRNRAAPLMS